ncbi:ABC transporter ATP-binding protein [Kutzneria kofuensis]|uniref:ABC-type multidrug transport system fused ATPase/permease subunit n=1 Tax=Kutzneria kofuensis TaxID=103725 RepID=A0A7W9KND2_9PSEU|nr:ABC transporter ATP-binding protein [Kutzneria kofuensis]MBB5895009.1 ABC-type multidrug transport system fused ATPase/permease subunit [Kutzneria kofuensis]
MGDFIRALWRAHRGLAAAWWILLLAQAILPAAFAYTTGALISATEPTTPLIGLATVFLLMQILAPLHAQVGTNLGDHLSSRLQDRLITAATGPAGIAHLESTALAGELAVARDFDLGISGPPLALSMGMIAGSLVEALAGAGQAILLATYHWWAGATLAVAWLATHWLLKDAGVWHRDTEEVQYAQRRAEYTYRLAVDPPAGKEIRLFGLSDWTVRQFVHNRRKLVDLRWQATKLRQRGVGWTLALLTAANGVVFWTLAMDTTGLGQKATYAQAAIGTAALAFGGLNWALPPAIEAVRAALRLDRSMAEVGGLPTGSRMPTGTDLRFRNVRFSYPNADKPVLDGLDLTIPAGTSLAVVGLNGAGKTTLVKLICRLYDPTGGTVEADGADLKTLDLDHWRSKVTAVFQDFIRYQLPLRDNVAPTGASEEDIRTSLNATEAEFTGLDTVLSKGYDDGTDLSGGQWQRIALARALCAVRQGAGIVVLDEPTAQLDIKGETEAFTRFLEQTRGCTTILVSHRFGTVRQADRICVLDNGKVAELGTHDELMAANGKYRTMFDLQAARFRND